MRKTIFRICLLILILSTVTCAMAGSYHDLKPGVSTKDDADSYLGLHLREIVPGERYEYAPDNDDTRRISIRFDPENGRIVAIDVYPADSHKAADFRDWFDLDDPERTEYDDNGNLVEFYDSRGIALQLVGSDPEAPVSFFRHFAAVKEEPGDITAGDTPPIPENARAYLGILIRNHPTQGILIAEILPGSAADKSDLRKGDIILEFEDATFYGKSDSNELLRQLAAAPVSRPVRFLVERDKKRLEVYTILDLRTEDAIARMINLASRESYEKAVPFYNGKKWEKAIPHLERAVMFNYRDTRAQEMLGYCCYREKRYEQALAAYEAASKAAPDSPVYTFWIATCYDKLGNREKAMQSYQAYLQTGHSDSDMVRDAQKRLDYLRDAPQRKANNAKAFRQMIDIIGGEIDEFNKDDD
jgi:tetratricopeptide (TPR) repeat protein